MNMFQSSLRMISKAVRSAPSFTSRSPRLPRLQQHRHASWGSRPQYNRFGDRKGGQQQQWSNFRPVYRAQYIWRNYQKPILVVTGTGGVVYVYNLEEVPITRRRRFNIISPEAEQQMMGGTEAYEMILKEFRGKILPAEHPHTRLVTKVVERLLPATGGLAGGEWRVHVVDDPNQKNAFVMPGGKVFVFTGILPICQDEAGLAAVLGHEIAHNVAHHAAERLSRSSITMIIALGFSLLFDVGGQLSNSITDLFLTLPNSRTQEAEADHIGLMIMAESCYNPSSALDFWARMKTAEQVEVPQFISTHPSHGDRAKHIKEWLPEAQRKYDDKGCGPLAGYAEDFKQSFGMRRPSSRPVQLQERLPSRRRDDDDDFF